MASPDTPTDITLDPDLDLILERIVPVRRELVWRAWTEPELLVQWFTPAPWSTAACEIDLRPGGLFRTVMRDPDGNEHPSDGCYLEVRPQERLVLTDALGPGYRPNPSSFMTAIIRMEDVEAGTRYTAIARHGSQESKTQHEQMGFVDGWGSALDQLVAASKGW